MEPKHSKHVATGDDGPVKSLFDLRIGVDPWMAQRKRTTVHQVTLPADLDDRVLSLDVDAALIAQHGIRHMDVLTTKPTHDESSNSESSCNDIMWVAERRDLFGLHWTLHRCWADGGHDCAPSFMQNVRSTSFFEEPDLAEEFPIWPPALRLNSSKFGQMVRDEDGDVNNKCTSLDTPTLFYEYESLEASTLGRGSCFSGFKFVDLHEEEVFERHIGVHLRRILQRNQRMIVLNRSLCWVVLQRLGLPKGVVHTIADLAFQ